MRQASRLTPHAVGNLPQWQVQPWRAWPLGLHRRHVEHGGRAW